MTIIRRIIGLLLILAAIGGLLISIGGLVAIWNVEPALTANLQSVVDLLNTTMETTSDGLVVTKDALQTSVDTIGNLETTMTTTAETIGSTNPMLDDIAVLMKENLPNTINTTQQSLTTAAESAQVIDGLLGTLSSIPLIGAGFNYEPEVPLSVALTQVSESLEGLPETFASMEENLRNTQSNIQTFEADMTVMAASIGQMQNDVAQYERVVAGYQSSIDQVQAQLEAFSANIPQITRILVWGLSGFLLWMAIAQLGLLTQGWELLTEKGRRELAEDIAEDIKEEILAEPVAEVKAADEDKKEPD